MFDNLYNPCLDKKRICTCMIGHEGHGKTTLVSAISAVLMKNKIVQHVNVGGNGNRLFVECQTDKVDFFMDCPSNNDKSTITNLAMADIAVLVIDAIDGPMAQTREHILLSRQVGVHRMVVFMNKCDMVDNDNLLDLFTIRNLLNSYGFDGDNIPIIRGSALKALEGDTKNEKAVLDLVDAIHTACIKNTKDKDLKKTK